MGSRVYSASAIDAVDAFLQKTESIAHTMHLVSEILHACPYFPICLLRSSFFVMVAHKLEQLKHAAAQVNKCVAAQVPLVLHFVQASSKLRLTQVCLRVERRVVEVLRVAFHFVNQQLQAFGQDLLNALAVERATRVVSGCVKLVEL